MVRSNLLVRELANDEPRYDMWHMEIYYVAERSGNIYDCSKMAPFQCLNCSKRHFRFACPYAIGSEEEEEFRSTQRRLTSNSPVVPVGVGYVLCLNHAAARRWQEAQHGRIVNKNSPVCPDFLLWLESLEQAAPCGDNVVDGLATLLGSLGVNDKSASNERPNEDSTPPDLNATLHEESDED